MNKDSILKVIQSVAGHKITLMDAVHLAEALSKESIKNNDELRKAIKEAATALQVFQNASDKVQGIRDEISEMDIKQRATLKALGL